MKDDNENIKYISEMKSKTFLEETEKSSYELIKNIKNKIMYINLYETYSDNLDFINYVQNKTIIDLIENSYNEIIKIEKEMKMDFLNISSDLIIKKKDLFNISKLTVNEINTEIREIFLFIKNYTSEYKEENIFNILYNLFKINELFFENSLKFLLDELKKIIKETIHIHLATMNSN